MNNLTEYDKQSLLIRERFREIGLPGNGMMALEHLRAGVVMVSRKGQTFSVMVHPDHLEIPLSDVLQKLDLS